MTRSMHTAMRVIGRRLQAVHLSPAIWRTMKRDLFDPYRPELHYMRGPGPRYREKWARAPQ